MKSVVVEASTVAKAIEIAWHKAEKPEEFFTRILQEHQSGFLGFGSQKAKIVLFFKNSQKSDSSFPVVLKQKEYANLFDNHELKVPDQLNLVDTQLNQNIKVHQQKNKQKKSIPAQQKQSSAQPQKQHVEEKKSPEKHNVVLHNNHGSKNEHGVKQQSPQKHVSHKPDQVSVSAQKAQQTKPFVDDKKNHDKTMQQEKIEHQKKSSQQPSPAKQHEQTLIEKDQIVQDIARALQKVQSQKIVANVSRSTPSHDTAAAHEKKNKQHKQLPDVKKTINEPLVAEVSTANVVQKFKRRPLNVDHSKPSGITQHADDASTKSISDIAVKISKDTSQ